MKTKKIIGTVLACAMFTTIIPIYNTSLKDNMIVEATTNSSVNLEKSQKLINMVNEYREENGLEAFKTCDIMNSMATVRANEVSTKEYSIRPNGKYYSDIFVENNINTTIYNQNIYWGGVGFNNPEDALESFKENERQNNNMLSTAYEYIGIGVVTIDNYTYYYQLFCTSQDLNSGEVITTSTTTEVTIAPIETDTTTTTSIQTTVSVTDTTTSQATTTEQPPIIVETTIAETLSDEQLKQKYNLDVNKDGNINTVDILILKKYILGILYK